MAGVVVRLSLWRRETVAPRVIRTTVAKVLEVRAVAANPEQLVLVVATPAGCAQ
jgi:hypothetical protein